MAALLDAQLGTHRQLYVLEHWRDRQGWSGGRRRRRRRVRGGGRGSRRGGGGGGGGGNSRCVLHFRVLVGFVVLRGHRLLLCRHHLYDVSSRCEVRRRLIVVAVGTGHIHRLRRRHGIGGWTVVC